MSSSIDHVNILAELEAIEVPNLNTTCARHDTKRDSSGSSILINGDEVAEGGSLIESRAVDIDDLLRDFEWLLALVITESPVDVEVLLTS
jgi:hypothetical protein